MNLGLQEIFQYSALPLTEDTVQYVTGIMYDDEVNNVLNIARTL